MEGKRSIINGIAKERIEILFGLAEKAAQSDAELSSSYVSILEKISTHYKVGLPSEIKNRLCKKCSLVLIPGLNCDVVIGSSKGFIIYRCKKCGLERHIRYKPTS